MGKLQAGAHLFVTESWANFKIHIEDFLIGPDRGNLGDMTAFCDALAP
ncbi:MAG: hypothetical protein ABIQ99_09785 [Thermoflexales bacterium]